MTTNPVPNPELLKGVEEAFSKYLNESGGQRRHWPRELQQLAARAVDGGHTATVVAKTVSVCRETVSNWCKKDRTRAENHLASPAVELKVVESRDRQKSEKANELNPGVARILFLSGAILECPVSALTAEILTALNETRR